jgi:ferredoxin
VWPPTPRPACTPNSWRRPAWPGCSSSPCCPHPETLQAIHIAAYYIHDLTFFFFLCFLPLGKHFHVITSLFNVFFMRIDKGNVKPVQHGITDEQLDDLESFGVKRLEDFTWKHMLDFYSCADCGRCSDNCPANAVGRPLSPRFISIKGRDLMFKNYPIYPYGSPFKKSDGPHRQHLRRRRDLVLHHLRCLRAGVPHRHRVHRQDRRPAPRHGRRGHGAPEPAKTLACPGKARQPLGQNGKETRRLDQGPARGRQRSKTWPKRTAEALYFVDSITSYDDRMQAIGQATATILSRAGADVGILGKRRKTAATRSGDSVKRCSFRP